MKGTPKTLFQAIENGFDSFSELPAGTSAEEGIELIRRHVKDWLGQRFTVAICAASRKPFGEDELHKLFKECTR